MSQPLDRTKRLPELGSVDWEAGEFWVENPFMIAQLGNNLSAFEPNRLFLNTGRDAFMDASFASSANIDSDSRSVVAADFDRDGAPDLLVGSVGGGPLRLFLNRFPGNASRMRLDLVGKTGQRAAIGSRVEIDVGDRRIVRDLFPANGFMGQAPPELTIGLGQAQQIDRLRVRWPSGETLTLNDVPVQAQMTIREGKARSVLH